MRDLYKRLGVSPRASRDEIEFALEHRDYDSTYEDCDFVLRNSARRKVYDRNRESLVEISRLRRQLGLTDTPHWDHSSFGDFMEEYQPVAVDPKYRKKKKSKKRQMEIGNTIWDKPLPRFWIVFGILLVFYLLMYAVFY